MWPLLSATPSFVTVSRTSLLVARASGIMFLSVVQCDAGFADLGHIGHFLITGPRERALSTLGVLLRGVRNLSQFDGLQPCSFRYMFFRSAPRVVRVCLYHCACYYCYRHLSTSIVRQVFPRYLLLIGFVSAS